MSVGADGERSTEDRKPASGLRSDDAPELDSPPYHGLTWRGYLVQLLHIASSIEHALMVQYLYAAYSLDPKRGTDQNERRMINRWRNLLLSVAKEEMGHMLTVQNLLCLLGAPVELVRENHPWDSDFYPFQFKLERLTVESLTRYVCAEMPEKMPAALDVPWFFFNGELKKYRMELPNDPTVPHVGLLYRRIIEIITDPYRIQDSDLHSESFPFQASGDDWGRGHKMPSLKDSMLFIFPEIPLAASLSDTRSNVIIERMATRRQAIDALNLVAEQGEAAPEALAGSHFQRFLDALHEYQGLKEKHGPEWEPTHQVADNPHTRLPNEKRKESESLIIWPRSEKWANLFNLRYRMLLSYLSHSFQLARDDKEARLRGVVIHKVFSEMYNLKAVAGILVGLPLKDPNDPRRAGPPFQMPYTLALPTGAIDRWRMHRDLVDGCLMLNSDLQDTRDFFTPIEELSFLRAMEELDGKSADWIEQLVGGLSRGQALSS
jgi:hypothetical protein